MDKREQDRLRTRKAILDAAENLMREDGYAAVTSRRVAERAGLKSQLVHYHFGTMDELFQAAYRRSDKRFFESALKMVSSGNPLQEIWANARSTEGGEVVAEYIAAANHRKILQEELVQSWSRFGSLYETLIAKQLQESACDLGDLTPHVLSFIITAVGKSIIEEKGHGYNEGHDEVIAFMDKLILKIAGAPAASKPGVARRAARKPRSA
jgi:AcrR family transcriptional regulator